MRMKRISRVIVAGCLAAVLLAAGVVFARGAIGPTLTFGNVTQAPTASLTIAPWFNRSVIFVRADGAFQVEPIVGAPPSKASPGAPAAPQKVELPGTVQNLRRVDRR